MTVPSDRIPADRIEDWADLIRCSTVIPIRSVYRVRKALVEGRDPEPYLADIEAGFQAVADTCARIENRPPACPTCYGTGVVREGSS